MAGKKKTEQTEHEIDFLAEAPKERPYHEAISDAHRQLLIDNGVPLPEPTT